MKAYDFHGKRNICGDRIREARLRARLSQSDLCRRLQLAGVIVERDVISRIENGGRFVADFEVVVIADVLEVSVDWLLGKVYRRSLPIFRGPPLAAMLAR